MLQDECDLAAIDDEEDADTLDMNIVKQMIGLKINEGDKEKDRNSSSDSDAPTSSANILCSSNKIFDFKLPSSKVRSYCPFVFVSKQLWQPIVSVLFLQFQCKRAINIIKRILRETDDKVVVVSQWTTFLSITADFLHRERIHYVELTGKTAIKDRNDIVVSFNKPNSPERVSIFLNFGVIVLNFLNFDIRSLFYLYRWWCCHWWPAVLD